MKTIFFTLACLFLEAIAVELQIELVPEDELGSRQPAYLEFEELTWKATSPWFQAAAPVCRVIERPMDLSRFAEEALKRGMVPNKDSASRGEPGDGAIDFVTTEAPWLGAGGNPRLRYFYFGTAYFRKFERDEHQMAVVKPLATQEESLAICRAWMKRLGIDEQQFSRQGDWAEGFEVDVSSGRVSRVHPVTKELVVAPFGQKLRFVQQIGGLPAFW